MKTLYLLVCWCLMVQVGIADTYEVQVTRKDRNLYKVTGKNIYIETKYCYQYVYYTDAILKMNGYTGEIIFLDDGDRCDVKGVYVEAEPLEDGHYLITVNREEDNWYSIVGYDLYIKTIGCLSLAFMEEAVLIANSGVYYTIANLSEELSKIQKIPQKV